MNIAYVCPEYPVCDSANGVSTYTSRMVMALHQREHRITTFSLMCSAGVRTGIRNDRNDVRVCWVKPGGVHVPILRIVYHRAIRWFSAGNRVYRDIAVGLRRAVHDAHREEPIDVLQCPEWAGLPWWLLSLRIPLVVRLHCPISISSTANGVPWSRKLRGLARAERRCIEAAPAVSAPSEHMITKTEEVLDLRIPGARIIPNPIDALPIAPAETRKSMKSILFVGRMDLLKGFDCLIKGFQYLAAKPGFSDVHLDVVGPDSGLLLDGTNRMSGVEYCRRIIQEYDVYSRINFAGRLSYEDVQMRRWRGRITVIPSRFENFPNTLVEAMSAGCAVVASDVGGIPEIVQHERNGLLFRSGDWQGLARCIERLLKDTPLRMRLGAQAQDDVRTRYNPQAVAAQTEEFYRDVIDRFRYDR